MLNKDSYDAIAARWAAQRTQLSAAEARLLPMVTERLARGAVVLDLGCGTGQPVATHFADAGFKIVGVDQSPEMLARARERLPSHEWHVGTIEEFPRVEHVSAVIAWDSLFHIPREKHAAIFQRVRESLPVGGRFALTAGGSEHPAFTDTMFGETFFYDSHAPAQTVHLLEGAGFRVVHQEMLNEPDGGRDKGRVAIIAAAISVTDIPTNGA